MDRTGPEPGITPAGLSADARLAALVQAHWGRVPSLTKRLEGAGFSPERPPTWARLASIPVLPKSSLPALQRQRPPFGGVAPTDHVPSAIFLSPAGVVEPMLESAGIRLAWILGQCGFVPADRVLNGLSYHLTPGGLHVHDGVRRLGAMCLPAGPQGVQHAAELALRAGATAFVGIATHFKLVLEAIDALADVAGSSQPASRNATFRVALAGAEPFAGGIRQEIESRWRVRCLDMYGIAETGVIAFECDAKAGLHVHPDVLVEVVGHDAGERLPDGEVGELVLTVDAPELPLLRFGTGDLVRIASGRCECGREGLRILAVLGRCGDSARVRGMLLHAAQVREFAQRLGGLAACRVAIRRAGDRDEIDVSFRIAQGHRAPASADAERAFRDACRLRASTFAEDAALPDAAFTVVDHRTDGSRP